MKVAIFPEYTIPLMNAILQEIEKEEKERNKFEKQLDNVSEKINAYFDNNKN